MTFKKYLDKVLDKTAFIEEFYQKRCVYEHSLFGFGEKSDDGEDESNYFFLYGTENSVCIGIDIHQEVNFNADNSITVIDTNNNVLTLTFFTATPIPHPTE
jgi:hypothetical protein